jgi:hypothetical protein
VSQWGFFISEQIQNSREKVYGLPDPLIRCMVNPPFACEGRLRRATRGHLGILCRSTDQPRVFANSIEAALALWGSGGREFG